MSVLMIYQDEIKDRGGLNAYLQAAGPTLAGRDFKARVVTEEATTVEGGWKPARVVVLEFPDRAAAMAWYDSPAYAEARKLRLAATSGAGIIVDTLP